MSRSLCKLAAAAAFAAAFGTAPASAVVLLDTTFSAAEGYNDGKLQFQNGNGPDGTTWLGQFNDTTGNPSVDSTAGTVSVISGFPPAGDSFLRNLWNNGATGALAGGGRDEIGAGFNQGDQIKIDFEYQFDLGTTAPGNASLFAAGVSDCFLTCSFDASPRAGFKAGWSNFEDGNLKVFTALGGERAVFQGDDNPLALFVSGADLGINNGFSGGTADLLSDNLRFTYTATLTDAATDLWVPDELVVHNIDTDTEVARATVDNPNALESFFWNTTAEDDIFNTPNVNEGGVANHPTDGGSEMWFAARWLDSTSPEVSASSGGARFEYLPNIPPVPGDYTGDGFVDAADYTVWRDSVESVGVDLPADGTGPTLDGVPDGVVDDFDRQFWAANYGRSAFAATAIPEPSSLLLGGLLMVGSMLRRR